MNNTLLNNTLEEEREGFKVDSLESATWCFRKLRAIAEKEAEIKTVAEEEINRINDWKEKELDQYAKDKEYFNYLLEEFYREERAKDKKFKLSTPYGKVSSRKATKWIYEDENSLLEYLKNNEVSCIRVKEEINKTDLKKVFKNGVNQETGEILPFVRIEEEESISIKVD